MCNLNLIVKSKKVDKYDLFAFLTATTTNSYFFNNHGDGIYTDNGIFCKSVKKIDYKKYINSLSKSKYILTHQRYATNGSIGKYTHPFESNDFVVGHNGILHNFVNERHSDTFVFFQNFIKEFEKQEGERKTKIKNTLNNLLREENGSYSIFIFDKKEKILYYLKNQHTSISFYRNEKKDFLYITTKEENLSFLKILKENFYRIPIKDYRIYKIVADKSKVRIIDIGEVQNPKNNYFLGRSFYDIFSKNDNEYNYKYITKN